MRWNMVMARAMVPPIAVFVASLVVGGLVGRVAQELGSTIFLFGMIATLFLLTYPAYRMLIWQCGRSGDCRYCGGPLGFERAGKVFRGRQLSDYRGCYSCGRNTPSG